MALRNYELDSRILDSARKEFLDKGYREASLRKIAEGAGVTIGAIRTRYKKKDDLFCALLAPFIDKINDTFQSLREGYLSIDSVHLTDQLETSMKSESEAILTIAFENYEDAFLLLCRSGGSSLEQFWDSVVRHKVEESLQFFHQHGIQFVDDELLSLLIHFQFDSYRRILAEGSDRKRAEAHMEKLMVYHFAGWKALFEIA